MITQKDIKEVVYSCKQYTIEVRFTHEGYEYFTIVHGSGCINLLNLFGDIDSLISALIEIQEKQKEHKYEVEKLNTNESK